MSQPNPESRNIMGTLPIPRLFFRMAPPLMLAMIMQGLYNLVDSIFVARLCEDALTAVSLSFPVDNLMIAVSVGTGNGINAILSRRLGQKRREDAEWVAGNGMTLMLLSAAVFAVLGFFFSRTFFSSQVKIPAIVEYGTEYLTVICGLSVGVFLEIAMERILQSAGYALQTMIIQITGVIINIALDPILIFGWFGFPALGIRGAAIATVIGRCAGGLLGVVLNHRHNRDVRVRFRKMRLRKSIVRDIYAVGFPSILQMSVGSVMVYFMDRILLGFVSTAAALFGIYHKISSFFFMPVFGINNAVIPIVAFNYGAENRGRIRDTVRIAMILATAIVVIGFAVAETFPERILALFKASENMMALGIPALRILILPFPVIGFSIICSGVFQALGKGTYSLGSSLIRQIVVLLPTAFLFSLTGNLTLVWYSVLLSELACLAYCILALRRIRHRLDGFPR